MKPSIKKLWLKALRGGRYKQTTGGLTGLATKKNGGTERRFCCLGVLCDLHAKATKKKEPWKDDGSYSNSRNGETLPNVVIKWAGLTSSNPVMVFEGRAADLAEINDVERKSFKAIAKLIEKQF